MVGTTLAPRVHAGKCPPRKTMPSSSDPKASAALLSPVMAVDANGLYWWHAIELHDGTVTPGERSPDVPEGRD